MYKKLLIILMIVLYSSPSFGSPSLTGEDGFLNTPGSEVINDRNINLGISYLPGPASYIYRDRNFSNLIYSMSLGFIPRTEIGIVFNQVFTGFLDKDNPYLKTSFFDRSVYLKVQLLDDSGYFPSLSIGGRDIISNSSINVRGSFITAHQQIFYFTAGKKFYDFKANIGYSVDPKKPFGFEHVEPNDLEKYQVLLNQSFRINGFFAAIESPKLFSLLSVIAEYDSKYFNYGLDIGPYYGLQAKVAMVNLTNFNIRFSWSQKL